MPNKSSALAHVVIAILSVLIHNAGLTATA